MNPSIEITSRNETIDLDLIMFIEYEAYKYRTDTIEGSGKP